MSERSKKEANPKASESSAKQNNSGRKLKKPSKEEVRTLLKHLLPLLEKEEAEVMQMPKEERKEAESWMDWGLNMVKEWGPTLMEVAPMLFGLF